MDEKTEMRSFVMVDYHDGVRGSLGLLKGGTKLCLEGYSDSGETQDFVIQVFENPKTGETPLLSLRLIQRNRAWTMWYRLLED